MNTTANKPTTREEMVAFLVNANDCALRGLLTLSADTIEWLNVMAEREAAHYATLNDAELEAACRAV